MSERRRRPRLYLTHTPDAFAKYYGDEALAALREVAEVRRNDAGRDLSGRELAEAAKGCELIVSYRLSHGPAELFENAPDLVAFLRCAVDIRDVDVGAASAQGVLVTRATPGFVPAVAELVLGQMVDLARGISRPLERRLRQPLLPHILSGHTRRAITS